MNTVQGNKQLNLITELQYFIKKKYTYLKEFYKILVR